MYTFAAKYNIIRFDEKIYTCLAVAGGSAAHCCSAALLRE